MANSDIQAGKDRLGRDTDTNLAAGTRAEPGCWAEKDWIPGGPGRGVKGRPRQAVYDWLTGERGGVSSGVPVGLSSAASQLLTGVWDAASAGTRRIRERMANSAWADSSRRRTLHPVPPPKGQRGAWLKGLRLREGGASGRT